ncbi:serine/threonine-protein kinase [Candidatus Thiodiazotropha sp. CDECU1]|uniref:serine/threonine-protein kinase n=1 Tax=Candidatus Thiodiazotropha sp. CDECU1 TaxID=3065865 RepID=UPI0029317CA6|nr:protein kinase [Candidatus Thiodiazotropha sp. CDECU1]
MATHTSGTQIPGYTMIRKVGSGGSADVYLAVQQNLNRRVALKLLKGALTADAKFGERFKREGRIIAQLNHPHIIPVYDIGEHDGHYYMAMEYLNGGDLRSQAERLTLKDLLQTILQVTDALQAAHERGFIHRDIKPANILFRNPQQAVLTDFGIARQTESLTQMTVTGAMLGTPAYMSPEQIAGRPLDGRTDLYSLGVTLFELLTGYQPYRGDSMMSVAIQHLKAEIPSLPRATSPLQRLVHQLLAKDPEQRIADAETLAQALQGVMDLPDISATPLNALWPEKPPATDSDASIIEVPEQSKKSKTAKSRMTTGIAAVGTIAAVGMIAWYLNNTAGINDNNQPASQIDSNTASEATQNITNERPILEDPTLAATTPWQETLTNANRLFEEGQLITPEGGNALALYREVLTQDNDNIIAKNGEQNILRRLVLEVERLIVNQSLDLASQQLEALKELWPEEQQLTQLQERITTSHQRIEAQNRATADASKQREIDRHLQTATSALIAGRYLKPPQESAHYHFNQALALDPKNQSAKNGLSQIAEILMTQIETATSNNDFNLAESLLKDLRGLDSRHPQLASLTGAIADAKASLARRQLEVQRLAEFQGRLDSLLERNAQWRLSNEDLDTQADYGNRLIADISSLFENHPDNDQLRSLYESANQHIKKIQARLLDNQSQQADKSQQRRPVMGGF